MNIHEELEKHIYEYLKLDIAKMSIRDSDKSG